MNAAKRDTAGDSGASGASGATATSAKAKSLPKKHRGWKIGGAILAVLVIIVIVQLVQLLGNVLARRVLRR